MEAMALGAGTRIGNMASHPDSLPHPGSSSVFTQGHDVGKLQPPASDVTHGEDRPLTPTSLPGPRAHKTVWSLYTLFSLTTTDDGEVGRPKCWVS